MLRVKKSKLFEKIFSIYNIRIIKRHFFSIRIKGENNIRELDRSRPAVIYANHSNWWDGLIAFYLSYSRWKLDAYMLMDEKQLKIHKFFRKIGAFSIDKSSGKKSYESVIYSANLLKNPGRTLWIFPQGEMLPYNTEPFVFYNGISKIISMVDNVNIIPLTFRYEFIKEQRPDILINIGKCIKYDNSGIKEFTEKLKGILIENLGEMNSCILKREINEFNRILRGKNSINKKNTVLQ